jgi:two-component system, NtrC family, sensor kinase
MTLALAHSGRSPGVTLANINLKLVWDIITAIRVGQRGYAFVTDKQGKLVAHPDMSIVLRGTDLSDVPDIRAVLQNASGVAQPGDRAKGLDGESVLRVHALVPKLDWAVFVDLPTREAYAPVWTILQQSGALLALGLLIAALLGAWLADRIVRPVKELQAGAEKLGEGDLAQRVKVPSRDEIGVLAERFNAMARRIQEAQETLEAKVSDRTAELARSLDELRSAQDRLVQTEKLASLGQLTAGIAHEIKNPLNFVNNFSELTRELLEELLALAERPGQLDDALGAEMRDIAALLRGNLEKILQHGRRADSIVRTMLLHSRGQGGDLRVIDLNQTVEDALNLAYHGARAEMQGFNVTLVRNLDPSAGDVEVYVQEFTRVLLNVIGNAFHAVRQKSLSGASSGWEPLVEVTTQGDDLAVSITVRDNGPGIPPAVRSRIFEPFFTTKPAGEGTGLGLSLSHDIIVTQHGGRLEVESEEGQGASFTVRIPTKQSKARAVA